MTWNSPRSHLEAVPDTVPGELRGEDRSGRLVVVMDSTGEVSRVTVGRLEPDDALREPDPLAAALSEAWVAAEAARLETVLQEHPDKERLRALGDDLLAGRYRVTLPEPPAVPEPDFPKREPSAETFALLDGRWSSEPGPGLPPAVGDADTVRVVLRRTGAPDRVVVNPDWIVRVSAAGLSAALTRALAGSRHLEEVVS